MSFERSLAVEYWILGDCGILSKCLGAMFGSSIRSRLVKVLAGLIHLSFPHILFNWREVSKIDSFWTFLIIYGRASLVTEGNRGLGMRCSY